MWNLSYVWSESLPSIDYILPHVCATTSLFTMLPNLCTCTTKPPNMINVLNFDTYFFFQRELDDVVSVWGNHKVRPTRQGVCPHGRPEVLYHCPELYGAMDYACQVSIAAIEAMRDVCQFPELSVDADFVELVQILRQDNHWIKPSTAHEAVIQYLHMRHIPFQWS